MTSLRWQLLLSLVVLIVATVLLASTATFALMERNIGRQARSNAEAIAELGATTMSASLDARHPIESPRNRANLQRLTQLFAEPFAGSQLRIWHPEARTPIAAFPEEAARRQSEHASVEVPVTLRTGQTTSSLRELPNGLRAATVFTPLRVGARRIGVVQYDFPMYEIEELVRTTHLLMVLYLILDALFILIAGYALLTRQIVRPVAQITRAAERVAGGDLTATVDITSRNEIGRLAANFDRMVERLRESRAQLEQRVTDLAELNRQLETAQHQLIRSEKLASVGRLAAGVAHEVGNPLSAAIGLAELLRDHEDLTDDEIDDLLARSERELQRINATIQELTDYARPDDARLVELDVTDAVDDALRLCEHHPKSRAVSIDRATPPEDATVIADPHQLAQVFVNLLLNAADATDGTGTVRIELERRVAADGVAWVVVSVTDDGPGFPADTAERIFDPFFTTKPPGEGTGLGLAICERIIDQFGGDISASSPPDGGARFEVALPAANQPGPAPEPPHTPDDRDAHGVGDAAERDETG